MQRTRHRPVEPARGVAEPPHRVFVQQPAARVIAKRTWLLLAPLVVGALLTGCGRADDQQQIKNVLVQGFTTNKPTQECEGALSSGLLKKTYGSATRCRTAERDPEKGKPTAVEVSGVKVDGDAATAFVELKGGDQDGTRGAIELVRQGEDWRIDAFSAALLRSTFEATMKADRDLPAAVRACLTDGILKLPDGELLNFAYATIGQRPDGQKQLRTMLAACQSQSSGERSGQDGSSDVGSSLLRKKFEEGIVQSLRGSGASQKAIGCVKRELRKRISDEKIVALVAKGGDEAPPEVTQAVAGALAACGTTP